MKFAIACLLGLASAAEPVWTLRSVQDHRTDSDIQKAYGDHSTTKANGRPPYQSAIQIEGDKSSSSDHSKEWYPAWEAVKDEEEGYHRAIPSWFSGDDDDLFMKSMIKTYALEGKNKDGSPNGTFKLDEAGARAAASEVLGTHKSIKGDAAKKYLDTYFARTFAHFDVTKDGKIEVIKMPQFMRFLASDQYMSLLP